MGIYEGLPGLTLTMDISNTLRTEYIEKLEAARTHLRANGVRFENGLSDEEMRQIERRHRFTFPPDLRLFLKTSMPTSSRFINWRGPSDAIQERFDWPSEGICFDVGNNVFWWPEWGQRPNSDSEAIALAKSKLAEVPALIPIYSHAYLPAEPCEAENPIFSVYQADVIHKGGDLAEYLFWIFHDEDDDEIEDEYPGFSEDYRWIDFWSALAKQNVSWD